MLLNVTVAVAIAAVTPPPPDKVRLLVDYIRFPRR
jgi:hypothetical protein